MKRLLLLLQLLRPRTSFPSSALGSGPSSSGKVLALAPLAFLILVVAVMILVAKSIENSSPPSAVGDDDVEARLLLLFPVPVLFLRFVSFCNGACACSLCPPVVISLLLLLVVVVVLLLLVPFRVAARRGKEATFLG